MTRKLLAATVLVVAFATPAAALVDARECPPGSRGVVVTTLSRSLVVCTNA